MSSDEAEDLKKSQEIMSGDDYEMSSDYSSSSLGSFIEEDVKKRKKKRSSSKDEQANIPKKLRRFLDIEAGEGSDEEEEDDQEVSETVRQRELERLRKEAQSRKQPGTDRLRSVIETIEKRAKDNAAAAAEGGAAGQVDETGLMETGGHDYYENESDMEMARVPTMEDDKLFLVKTTDPGKERLIISQLMNKAKELKGECSGVKSFFCTDSLKGYIYIEAPSETAVKSFVSGIRRIQWYSAKIVPFREQLSIFKVAAKAAEIKFKLLNKGEYVKIKKNPIYHAKSP
jgi:transcription elongation factor SPT5